MNIMNFLPSPDVLEASIPIWALFAAVLIYGFFAGDQSQKKASKHKK
jgi:hypothetical protein